MSSADFDYFVIGGGSGGVRSARVAARHGARVGIAESRRWGGTCVNVGCVPKKLLALAAGYAADLRDASALGWDFEDATHDWATLIAAKDVEIARLNGVYKSLLCEAGCTIFNERAELVDARAVALNGRRVTAGQILIATGGRPVVPDYPGLGSAIFTSDEAFHLERMPRRVVIIGGGYIAAEFAGIFHGLGAEVSLVCRNALMLRGFDMDLRTRLGHEIQRSGVTVHLGREVARIERRPGHLVVRLNDGIELVADGVLYAVGRKPNTESLGLHAAGVASDAEGAILVDASYATNVPNIYAIGDATNRVNLTPVAIAEGQALADRLFGDPPRGVSYDNIPTAVFSDPAVGTVGLTEATALERYGAVRVFRTTRPPVVPNLLRGDEQMFVKMIVDASTDRVLGCHMIGRSAPEMLQGIAVALNCGVTKAQLDGNFGIDLVEADTTLQSDVVGSGVPGHRIIGTT